MPTLDQIRRALDQVCPYTEDLDGWFAQTIDAKGVLASWGDQEAIGEHLDTSGYVAVACDQWGWAPHPPEVVRRLLEAVGEP